jgi:RNA polymerase sigma-70 factor (ECF subfamily)
MRADRRCDQIMTTSTAEHPEPDPGSESGQTWTLVRAAQAGDAEAFGHLYDRYSDAVYRFVLFRLGDRQVAEDLTSETFLRALRKLATLTYQGKDAGAWFITIARNLVLDHVKSGRVRLEVSTGEFAERPEAGHDPGPEQQAIATATYRELMACVAQLSPEQQECIVLRFMQGFSVAETARAMERNDGAIKALQHRAVRRLAQLLPDGLR